MGRNYASLTLSYSWEGFMQNVPPVTLGEELCNICVLHKSFIIYNLYTIFMEGFMQKSKRVNACSFPCNWL